MMDFDIQDDMAVDPEQYPDRETGPRPPLPGNYLLKSGVLDFVKNKAGEIVKWKGQYPLFNLVSVEITDPFEYGRKVGLFQQVATMPFEREAGKLASPAGDLLRALDADVSTANTGETIREVRERLTQGQEFRGRLDYQSYDKAYADKLIADAGGKDNIDKKELNKLYSKAKVNGYNNIVKQNRQRSVDADAAEKLGISKWIGPSGQVYDVRPYISVFYPANDTTVKLGPDAKLIKQ